MVDFASQIGGRNRFGQHLDGTYLETDLAQHGIGVAGQDEHRYARYFGSFVASDPVAEFHAIYFFHVQITNHDIG